jgi:hypothetical protein
MRSNEASGNPLRISRLSPKWMSITGSGAGRPGGGLGFRGWLRFWGV